MPNFIIGFYRVPGVSGTVAVEAPLTGHPGRDYARLFDELKKQFPELKPGEAIKVSSTIETRNEEARFLNPYPGMTLRQVFTEEATADGSGAEIFREAGTVFFDGSSHYVIIRYLQDKGTVGLTLNDRMTKTPTRFSNQINASVPVEELPKLIGEILGDYKELKIRLMKHDVPAPVGQVANAKPVAAAVHQKPATVPSPKKKQLPAFEPPAELPPKKNPDSKTT